MSAAATGRTRCRFIIVGSPSLRLPTGHQFSATFAHQPTMRAVSTETSLRSLPDDRLEVVWKYDIGSGVREDQLTEWRRYDTEKSL
jgi:hypothetical protein